MGPYQTKKLLPANETTQRMKMDLPNKRKYLQVIQLTHGYYAKYKNSKILMTEIPKYNNLKMDSGLNRQFSKNQKQSINTEGKDSISLSVREMQIKIIRIAKRQPLTPIRIIKNKTTKTENATASAEKCEHLHTTLRMRMQISEQRDGSLAN